MSEPVILTLVALYALIAIGFAMGIGDAMEDIGIGGMPDKGFSLLVFALLWPAMAVLLLARKVAAWLAGSL